MTITPDEIAMYERIERNRRELTNCEPTEGALAYARYLDAVESDATYGHGGFGRFCHNDQSVLRRWPFLGSLVKAQQDAN